MSDRLREATGGGGGGPKKGFGAWIAGRANRKEYWIWVVPWLAITVVIALLAPGVERILGVLLLLVWIRRLHDLGWSGWLAPLINIAVAILGFAGSLIPSPAAQALVSGLASLTALVVLGALPGQSRANEFGPPPGQESKDLAETFG